MIETAGEFMSEMRLNLDNFNSWSSPIFVNGKHIKSIEIVKDDKQEYCIEIKTE